MEGTSGGRDTRENVRKDLGASNIYNDHMEMDNKTQFDIDDYISEMNNESLMYSEYKSTSNKLHDSNTAKRSDIIDENDLSEAELDHNTKKKRTKTDHQRKDFSRNLDKNNNNNLSLDYRNRNDINVEYLVKTWVTFHLNPFLKNPEWMPDDPENTISSTEPYISFVSRSEYADIQQLLASMTTTSSNAVELYQTNPFSQSREG